MSENNEANFAVEDSSPTLEQEAAAMGIDVGSIDYTAEEQGFSNFKKETAKPEKTETEEKILRKV